MKYPNGTTYNKETKTGVLSDGTEVKTDANGMVRVQNGGIFKNEVRWRHIGNVNSKKSLYVEQGNNSMCRCSSGPVDAGDGWCQNCGGIA